jgi:hypothetical protein
MANITIKQNATEQTVNVIRQGAILPTNVEGDNRVDLQALARLKDSAARLAKSLEHQSVASRLPQELCEAVQRFTSQMIGSIESLSDLSVNPLAQFLMFAAHLPERATQASDSREWRSFEATLKAFLTAGNEVVRRSHERELQKRTISFSLVGTHEDVEQFGRQLRQLVRETLEASQVELAEKYGWKVIRNESGKLQRIIAPPGNLMVPVLPLADLDDPEVCKKLMRNLDQNVAMDSQQESHNSEQN